MDYVVAGFGIGAIFALIGFALWELYGNSEEPGHELADPRRDRRDARLAGHLGGHRRHPDFDHRRLHRRRVWCCDHAGHACCIAGGTFWYWRADQAMLAAMPQQRRIAKPMPEASKAAVVDAGADVEPSEWDSWPDRQGQASAGEETGTEESVGASFEPEVAVEPAEAVVATKEAGQKQTDEQAIEDAAVQENEETVNELAQIEPESPMGNEIESASETGEDEADEPESGDRENSEAESDEPMAAEIETDKPEIEKPEANEPEANTGDPPVAEDQLPANVRPFRLAGLPASEIGSSSRERCRGAHGYRAGCRDRGDR